MMKPRTPMPPITLLFVNNGVWLSIDVPNGGKFAFTNIEDMTAWLVDYFKQNEDA